jgi:hypothetical protein
MNEGKSYAAPFVANNPTKNPVFINAHALGDKLPSCPLAVSPDARLPTPQKLCGPLRRGCGSA